MAFANWDFFFRVTELTIPSNISITGETVSPLSGLESLKITDSGAPSSATVAVTLDPVFFPNLVDLGRIRSIFQRKTGSGFRDQGFYFLASGFDPTAFGVSGYAVYMTEGTGFVRIAKFQNGLHDPTGFNVLVTHPTPFTTTSPVVMEAEWVGGVVAEVSGLTSIDVRFKDNTTDFSQLFPVGPTLTDPSYKKGFAGIWARSRFQNEPLDALIDDTSIFIRDFI